MNDCPDVTELGRISSARFGYGGYQDAMFGLSLSFEGSGWGIGTFEGGWSYDIKCDAKYAKWTEADREGQFVKAVRLLNETLKKAKKRHVAELVGVPVEVVTGGPGSTIRSWRVLEEVL